MLVSLRYIDCEIDGVFNIVVACSCESHEVGAAAFYFYHVADHLLIQGFLGQDADYEDTILNQADGSVF